MSAGHPLTWFVRSSLTWFAKEGVMVGPCGLKACNELATPCSVDKLLLPVFGGLATGTATNGVKFVIFHL